MIDSTLEERIKNQYNGLRVFLSNSLWDFNSRSYAEDNIKEMEKMVRLMFPKVIESSLDKIKKHPRGDSVITTHFNYRLEQEYFILGVTYNISYSKIGFHGLIITLRYPKDNFEYFIKADEFYNYLETKNDNKLIFSFWYLLNSFNTSRYEDQYPFYIVNKHIFPNSVGDTGLLRIIIELNKYFTKISDKRIYKDESVNYKLSSEYLTNLKV